MNVIIKGISILINKDIHYMRDKFGHTPIDYAIDRYNHKKTNILIDFLSKN